MRFDGNGNLSFHLCELPFSFARRVSSNWQAPSFTNKRTRQALKFGRHPERSYSLRDNLSSTKKPELKALVLDSFAIASRLPESTVLNGSRFFNSGFFSTNAGTRSRQ